MPPLPKGRGLAKGETVGYLACIYEPVHYLVAAAKIYSAIVSPLLKGDIYHSTKAQIYCLNRIKILFSATMYQF